MRMNAQGMGLLKAAEGCELEAYYDAVGVLTIGYGHTSEAGAPRVTPDLKISKVVADDILGSDLRRFEVGVSRLIETSLNSNQFSALTSFAYNVGISNFADSSVLRFVNAEKFDEVPNRLNLWNKADGEVLSGLVKRRAAEGALFMMPEGSNFMSSEVPRFRPDEVKAMHRARGLINKPNGKPMVKSTTMWTTLIGAATGIGSVAQQAVWQARDLTYSFDLSPRNMAYVTAILVIAACAVWVIKERHKKAVDDDV
jgi:lysozyme